MNPTSADRARVANRHDTLPPRGRRALARVLPAGTALVACLVLGAAAAVDGQVAALVLALWVGVLVVAGLRLSAPAVRRRSDRRASASRRMHAARCPVLILADLNEAGEIGASRTLPVIASDAAIAVLDARPRG